MTHYPKAFALAATLAFALPLSAGAEQLASATFSNFLPADQATVERFTCVGSTATAPDVVVEYGIVSKEPGSHSSRLRSLAVRGAALSPEMLREVNETVGGDTIASVSAGCAGDDVRVVLQVFRPDSIAPDACLADANQYLYIYYRGETKSLGFE